MNRCDECERDVVLTETLLCHCGSRETALQLCERCLSVNVRPEVVKLSHRVWQSTHLCDICDDCDGSHRATTGEW